MDVHHAEFHYYAPIPGPILLTIGAICILLAVAGIAVLFKLFKGKR